MQVLRATSGVEYWNINPVRAASFTKKYLVKKLVYFKCGGDAGAAIKRERKIKAGSRQKKIGLVDSLNLLWTDLFDEILG
jgi:putative endonuclease